MEWRERKKREEVAKRIGVESDPILDAEFLVIIYDRYHKEYRIDSAAFSKTEANRDYLRAKRAFPNLVIKVITLATAKKHFSGYSSTWKLARRNLP